MYEPDLCIFSFMACAFVLMVLQESCAGRGGGMSVDGGFLHLRDIQFEENRAEAHQVRDKVMLVTFAAKIFPFSFFLSFFLMLLESNTPAWVSNIVGSFWSLFRFLPPGESRSIFLLNIGFTGTTVLLRFAIRRRPLDRGCNTLDFPTRGSSHVRR